MPLPTLPASAPILTDPERLSSATDALDIVEEVPPSPRTLADPGQPGDVKKKRINGEKMRAADEAMELPKNNMWVVMCALALAVFLAAMDQTIVTTILPTIVQRLGSQNNPSAYSWVGVAYSLAMAVFVPLWGKLSDVVGRKEVFFPSIIIFLVGSGLCGAAQSMDMLIASRALQGIGGGGIMSMTQIVLSDIVTLQERGKYSAVIGACWGLASTLGPLLGGVLAEKASWRWAFWINLPTGGLAIALLFFCLKLRPHTRSSARVFLSTFDFVGVALFMMGAGALIAGFSFASDRAWSDPATIALLVLGIVLFALGIVNEAFFCKTRAPVAPMRLFQTRTTIIVFFCTFTHALIFICLTFYLPTYYQVVHGASATLSGAMMLPVSLGGSLVSVVVGPLLSHYQTARPFFWVGFGGMTLGFGLMILLGPTTSMVGQVLLPLVAGLATSMLFQPPLIALQAAMSLKDMSTSTSFFMLDRALASAVGISVGGTILQSSLRSRVALLPSVPTSAAESILSGDYKSVQLITDLAARTALRSAISDSIRLIWIVMCPLAGVSFVASIFLRHYSLIRSYTTAEAKKEGDASDSAASAASSEKLEKDEDFALDDLLVGEKKESML